MLPPLQELKRHRSYGAIKEAITQFVAPDGCLAVLSLSSAIVSYED